MYVSSRVASFILESDNVGTQWPLLALLTFLLYTSSSAECSCELFMALTTVANLTWALGDYRRMVQHHIQSNPPKLIS